MKQTIKLKILNLFSVISSREESVSQELKVKTSYYKYGKWCGLHLLLVKFARQWEISLSLFPCLFSLLIK